MELKDFAERILFDGSLEGKLAAPDSPLTDHQPFNSMVLPNFPARHSDIGGLVKHRTAQLPASSPLPKPAALGDTKQRGILLHHFANHELLALELIALALLRFPDIGTQARLHLARIAQDEQRHLRMYLKTMRESGVALGDFPLSSFFWDVLHGVDSFAAFVSGMNLTLEQANLDYARYYAQAFARVGDHATAALLTTIHDDELNHVRYGVEFLEQNCPMGESLWEYYQRLLPNPLTPQRAKGLGFSRTSRMDAKMPTPLIDAIENYTHSKGRLPDLYYFNPGAEESFASSSSSPGTAKIAQDLAVLMGILASADDIVVVPQHPSHQYLEHLQSAGWVVPKFLKPSELPPNLSVRRFIPWGHSPDAVRFASQHQIDPRQPLPTPDAKFWRKDRAQHWLSGISEAEGYSHIATSEQEVLRLIAEGHHQHEIMMFKAPLASSGRGNFRISRGRPLATDQAGLAQLRQLLNTQQAVLVEPWLHKICDLSLQLILGEDNIPINILGMTRFVTDGRGRYRGHHLRNLWAGLSATEIREIHERGLIAEWQGVAQKLGQRLLAEGYRGPLGIDAFLYREAQTIKLRPVVEINPRLTMGRLALAIEKRIATSAQGYWQHGSAKSLRHALQLEASSWSLSLSAKSKLTHHQQQLSSGLLCTNDPGTASSILTVLEVARANQEQRWLKHDDRTYP